MLPIKFKVRKRDMRKIVEHWELMKELGIVCEHQEGERRIILLKLWGDMYMTPNGQEIYRCKKVGLKECKCEFDEYFTELWMRLGD